MKRRTCAWRGVGSRIERSSEGRAWDTVFKNSTPAVRGPQRVVGGSRNAGRFSREAPRRRASLGGGQLPRRRVEEGDALRDVLLERLARALFVLDVDQALEALALLLDEDAAGVALAG